MATLRDIRKRINSIKNTQKITRAMKMVAAAKLRRAQSAVIGARPYAQKMDDMLKSFVARSEDIKTHPLFVNKESLKKVDILVYTSNRGLCGGFNSNLLRHTLVFLKDLEQKGIERRLTVIGKKGRDFFKARQIVVDEVLLEQAEEMTVEKARALADQRLKNMIDGEIDAFYLIFNGFVSVVSQEITTKKVLPLSVETTEDTGGMDFIYEPSREQVVEDLIPRNLTVQIYRAHLESRAAELGARMSAMENATNNAKEMISSLTLQFNRARQAAITTELMDIVNGAEALK